MLTFLRDNAKSGFLKFILLGFLVLAGGGLVLMDVGNFFRDGVSGNTNVMVIGQEKVPMTTFSTMLNRALSRQGIDVETAYRLGLIDQMINSEISNSLTYQAAHDLGVQVSDKLVAKQIGRLLQPSIANGMSKEDAFRRVLQMQGMTELGFIQALKQEMTNTILRNALLGGTAWSSDKEVADLYRFQHEARDIEGVFFPNDKVKDYQEPTDEVLLPLYQAGPEKYAIPETRNFTIAVLTHDAVKDSIEITEDELREIYEDEIDSFTMPERRKLEQSVLENQAAAMTVIDKMNNDGKSMKQAVTDVTGGADAYLGEEDFQKDGLFEEIADTAFGAAQVGDVIGPFETPLGWHVLKLTEVMEPAVQPFAELEKTLRQEVMQERLASQMYDLANNLDNQVADGTTVEDIAAELDLDIKSYGPLREDGSTSDAKEGLDGFDQDRGFILETVFELLESETAPVMELGDGRFALIRVDTVKEKSYQPFDEVKGDLAAVWVKDQQQLLNKMNVQKEIEFILIGEKDLKTLARENGLSIKSFKNIKRVDSAPEGLSSTAKTKFFDLAKGEYTVTSAPDGYFIGHVTKVSLPDASKAKEEELARVKDVSVRGAMDEFMLLFLENEREKRGVEINQRAIEQFFGPGREQQAF